MLVRLSARCADLHPFDRFDWISAAHRAMDVVVPDDDRIRAAIDEAANALQTAVLLLARVDADHGELRRALERATRALVACRPTPSDV